MAARPAHSLTIASVTSGYVVSAVDQVSVFASSGSRFTMTRPTASCAGDRAVENRNT
jgi:hypothetical protein